MKATLQLDPNVDIVGNRLPNVFIKHRPAGERIHTEQIGRLARGLDQNSALVIFPEGGNWPPDDGAAGYCGWSTWDIRIWPNGPGKCPTCSRRAPVARAPPSRPARRRRDLRRARRPGHHHHPRRRLGKLPINQVIRASW